MTVTIKEIVFQAGNVKIPGLFCLPQGIGPHPIIIVFHGSDGFKPNHAKVAEKLALEGFAVLAPTWFGGDPARSYWSMIRIGDILEMVSWLKKEPAVDVDRLGLLGFSRGGGLALIMGSLIPQTQAIVNFFGLTSWKGGMQEFLYLPLNRENPMDFIQKISCPILSFHGEADTVVSVENTYQLDHICRRYGIEHHYIVYPGIHHSFVWPGDKYNQKAHLNSWDRALQFLKKQLMPS